MSELFPERRKEEKREESALSEAPSFFDNLSVKEASHRIGKCCIHFMLMFHGPNFVIRDF